MLFGHVLGVALSTFSAVVGATLAFLIARHLLHDWAHARFARAFKLIDAGIARDGPLYLFMLRLIVVVPFFVVNPVMGLTDMRLATFVIASVWKKKAIEDAILVAGLVALIWYVLAMFLAVFSF